MTALSLAQSLCPVGGELALAQDVGKFQCQRPRPAARRKDQVQIDKQGWSVNGYLHQQIVSHRRDETASHDASLCRKLFLDGPLLDLMKNAVFRQSDRGEKI